MPTFEDTSPATGQDGHTRLTVSELTGRIKGLLEDGLPTVVVEGELSNYVHHSSGHRYFTLKDSASQLRCVMFKWQAARLGFTPEEGMKLEAVGNVTVYERAGQYQLNVVRLLPVGRGELLAMLEERRKRLDAEGVFDNRRTLPPYPGTVGVVTSPTGAAVRDIINVLTRRAPNVRIVLRPALVQGDGAPADIVRAIAELNRLGGIDVLIVGRGGGSIEDLWCFNDEDVARAIHASAIPVVSAVGHEIDFTLTDFAADLRAPTPSAAAELVVKDADEVRDRIAMLTSRMRRAVLGRLDELTMRTAAVGRAMRPDRFLTGLAMREQAVDELAMRLGNSLVLGISQRETRLERCRSAINAMNPRAILQRGYSIVYRRDDRVIVNDSSMVGVGDGITVELARGGLTARIEGNDD